MVDPDAPPSEFDRVLGDCPFEGCGLPYSLEQEQLFPSSDPTDCALVWFYRCAGGHFWPEVRGAGVPLDD